MPRLPATPGQTVGPFFGYALPFDRDNHLVPPGRADALWLHGTLTDGQCAPVPDALVEVWQADADGAIVQRAGSLRRDGRVFSGWGRASTDDAGNYGFSTVRPGATGPGKAPSFHLTVFARGLMDRLSTRAYLPHEPSLLDADALLRSVAAPRRETLIARADADGYRFDIRMQGADETVFLTHRAD